MEDVVEVYHSPYGPKKPGQPERFDYEYERNGTASIFLFTEPLVGWRRVSVREHRTSIDWAKEIRYLLEERYPGAEKVVLVCDNLNAHTITSLYQAFPPEEARSLAKRLDFHYTPKHGSWLNIVEIELSALTKQCLGRRIPDLETLGQETEAWYVERNESEKSVDWRFTTADARIRLRHLCPQRELTDH